MSKQIYPAIPLQYIQAHQIPADASITSINTSHINKTTSQHHQSSLTPIQYIPCFNCKSSQNSALIQICNCSHKLFHQNCLKQWLNSKLNKFHPSIKSLDNKTSILCPQCSHQIQFILSSTNRPRTFQQLLQYSHTHKLNITIIIIITTLIIGCLIYLLLLALNIIIICINCTILTKIVMIGLGVGIGVLGIVALCCFYDCVFITETKVEKMYQIRDRNHSSRRYQHHYKISSDNSISSNSKKRQKQQPSIIQLIQ